MAKRSNHEKTTPVKNEFSKRYVTNLLAHIPGIVWESKVDKNGNHQRLNYINSYVEEMLGYSAESVIKNKNPWRMMVHEDDRRRVEKEIKDIIKNRTNSTVRMRLIPKNGPEIWTETKCSVIEENGRIIGLHGVTMDITESIEAELRKDQFISLASHELRTPLTSLKVYNHLFSKKIKKLNDPTLDEPLVKMNNQIDKLSNLISDLLDLSRIQAGKLLYKLEQVDIDRLIDEVVDATGNSFSVHKIKIKGSTGEKVFIDQNRISQVITNFLTNAAKYSPSKNKIIVTREVLENDVVVTVKDFGLGIPKKHQRKIFERFYQVDPEEKRTVSGLGIGLYISQAIIKKHNGQIGMRSKTGKGSEFYFTLPIPNNIHNE